MREKGPLANKGEVIAQLRELLTTDVTYERQTEALALLSRHHLGALECFDPIHAAGERGYARPADNIVCTAGGQPVAEYFAIRANMQRGDLVADLGSGQGRDSLLFADADADVFAVDHSRVANERFGAFIRDHRHQYHRWLRRIQLMTLNFMTFLQTAIQSKLGVTHAFSWSTLHYYPPLVRQQIFDMVYEALEPGGYFGVGQKTIRSSVAHANDLIRLGSARHEFPTLHPDGVLRHYLPDDLAHFELQFTNAGFEMMETHRLSIEGFEGPDDEDYFLFGIAQKPND